MERNEVERRVSDKSSSITGSRRRAGIGRADLDGESARRSLDQDSRIERLIERGFLREEYERVSTSLSGFLSRERSLVSDETGKKSPSADFMSIIRSIILMRETEVLASCSARVDRRRTVLGLRGKGDVSRYLSHQDGDFARLQSPWSVRRVRRMKVSSCQSVPLSNN